MNTPRFIIPVQHGPTPDMPEAFECEIRFLAPGTRGLQTRSERRNRLRAVVEQLLGFPVFACTEKPV